MPQNQMCDIYEQVKNEIKYVSARVESLKKTAKRCTAKIDAYNEDLAILRKCIETIKENPAKITQPDFSIEGYTFKVRRTRAELMPWSETMQRNVRQYSPTPIKLSITAVWIGEYVGTF